MWPMFFAGFAFMFVFTYQFALKISRRINIGIIGAYIGFLVWLYAPSPIGYGRGLEYITRAEFIWIPIILYLLALVFAGAVYIAKKMMPSNKIEST